jgi:hypothetical protein
MQEGRAALRSTQVFLPGLRELPGKEEAKIRTGLIHRTPWDR